MKNKVLIITYEMLPYSSSFGGCQRMYFLAEYLQENDIDVIVVAAKKNIYGLFGKKINFKTVYFGEEVTESNVVNNNHSIKKKIKQILRFLIDKMSNFYFNGPSNLEALRASIWLHKYKENILSIIKNETIDTIIISGPPFELFSFVVDVKKHLPRVKVILDYRDPWGLWNFNKSIAYLREKKYLSTADHIIVVTPSAKEDKQSFFNIDSKKIDVVYNGYSKNVWKQIEPKSKFLKNDAKTNKIIISFIGSIDFSKGSYRDTTNFLKAYEEFKDDFEIRFIGVDTTEAVKEIMQQYPDIKIIQKVTQEESLQYMVDSDVLLNLHTANDSSGKYLIQGKIFDYIKSGKIIVSIGSDDDYTNHFVKNKHFGFTSINDVDEIKNVFRELIQLKKNDKLCEFNKNIKSQLEEYSREYQNHFFVDIIKSNKNV